MINTHSFFDELAKIGEASTSKAPVEVPGEGPGGPFVTKDRLKRLMHVALVGAAGAGLGTAAGYATRDYLFKHHPNIVAKYAPVALPVLGGALGILQSTHRPHVDQYVRHGKT
jgi:hypothetical protein